MAQFVDHPLPASLELPRLQEPRPRHRGTENLRNGPGTGRVKGVQNRICRDLKEGLLQSAILHGYDGAGRDGLIGFCLHLAERHPKVHGGLLAKLLPYNLHADVNTAVPTITSVNIVSVPSGVHFSPEQMECAQQGKPFTIDYDQMREEPAPVEEPIEVRSPEEEQLLATLKAMNAEELLARLSNALVPQG